MGRELAILSVFGGCCDRFCVDNGLGAFVIVCVFGWEWWLGGGLSCCAVESVDEELMEVRRR